MNHSAISRTIRNFRQDDMQLLGDLYTAVSSRANAVFWWVGNEENWNNVFCAFENGRMVAKGQVGVINSVPPGRSPDSRHSIYLNLKALPERETDAELLEQIYACLVDRAYELKSTLSPEYGTNLCVGNDASEKVNSSFFIEKGFIHLNSLFRMNRNLSEPISDFELDKKFEFSCWDMAAPSEEDEYLRIESEVWPDTPLGKERLAQYKGNPLWTSMVVRKEGAVAGGLMAWKEEDTGVIEDVFVREPWRKRGLAKYLLTKALRYLKSNNLKNAYLMVLTSNQSALSLYESVGFYPVSEEIRYFIEMN